MAQTFKLLVSATKDQAAQTLDIAQGAGSQGKPVTVKAQAGARYQLAQTNSPQAPHTVRAKRVGKDLQVMLENSQQADLVIENYYDEMPAGFNALVGQAENGSIYEYIPEDANPAGLVPNLADGGNLVGMALGGSEEIVLSALPLVATTGGFGGLGMVAAGLGLAAMAGGGGGAVVAQKKLTVTTGALAAASDTGTQGDNLTSNKTPTITGKAEAGSKVEVTVNDKVYTTKADDSGNYSVVIPPSDPLPDGTYTPQIKVTDPAGNYSTADGTPFTIDTGTSVVITDPGKGTTTNTISGTSEPGATVTVKDAQNNTVGTALVDKDGHWTLTPTSPVPLGKLTASATDPAGNTANAQSDNTGAAPPVPAITSVTDNVQGQTGAIQKYVAGVSGGLGQGVTNDSTPTVNGTAAPGSTVTLYDAGQAVGTATVGPDGKWTITPSLTTDGVHTFTARATLAGVSSPTTGDYPILLDTVNPSTPVVDPTGTANNTGSGTGNTYTVIDTVGAQTGVVADQSTIDDATPTINGKGEVGATVTIYDKGQILGTALVGADGKWTFKPSTPFANGSTHTITTTMTDAAGNTTPASTGTTFTIDTSNTPVQLTSVTDDVAAVTGALNPNAITNDNTPTLTGTGTPNTTVTIKDNGTPIGTAQVDAQGNWTFTPTNALSEGAHSLVVTGTDKANNPSATTAFPLTVDTQAPAAPVISAFADDVGSVQNANTPTAQFTDDTTPTLKGTAEAGSTVTLKDATGKVVGTVKADAQGNWSYTLAELPKDDNYSYTATATDAAGNTSGDSNTFSLTLDTTPPSGQTGALAAVAASDSGTLGDNLTNVKTPDITGTAEPGAKVEVTVNGKTYPTTADANGNYSITIPTTDALPDGSYTPTIKVTDPAGNTSTASGTKFTVDATAPNGGNAPVVTLTTDANNDGVVNSTELNGGSTIAVKAAFDATKVAVGDTVRLSDGSTTKDVVVTAADITNGFVTTTFAKPAEGGTLTVTATVIDPAGNPTPPGSDSAKLDTIAPNSSSAPTVTITTDANNDGFVNSSELNVATTFAVQAAFDKTKVGVGDKVIFSDGNTTTPVTVTLADITNGFVTTTFAKPAEGSTLTVTATVVDAAGNSTLQGTDSAKLDTITPNNSAAPAVIITTDANNDGFVSSAELNGATTIAVKSTFDPTKVAVGDTVRLSDGTTTQNVVLTAADIANGFVTTSFAKPAEGATLSVTATVLDAAGNPSATGSDSAKLDTIAPNSSSAPTVTITTDANNDGFVNSSELNGATTIAVQAAFDKTKVAVGDKVIFSDGVTTTPVTVTLADITNGFVTTTFAKPAEGATLNVTATVIDPAGNPTPQGTDSAKLDTTAPTNAAVGLTVGISTDANNDAFVNATELNSATTFTSHITVNSTAVVGDKVVINASNGSTALTAITHTLTAADIANGFDVTFTKPSEGAVQTVTANYVDAAGNAATDTQATDNAKLDTTAPTNAAVGLTVAISTDANNDAFVNATELNSATTFTSHISVNSTAVVGDKVVINASNGSTALTAITHTLTATDIANGFDVTFTKPSEGAVQTVTANYVDAAGNAATDTQATDNAKLDTTAPTNAAVGLTVAISTDANNDAFVNATELNSATTFTSHISVNSTAVVGDKVVINASNGSTALTPITHTLTAADIANGFDVTFAKPSEGAVQTVTANYVDAAGNAATDTQATDNAKLDTTAPTNAAVGLTVGISTDANNDAFVNATELGTQTNFTSHISVNSTALVGDKVVINASNDRTALTPITHTLTAADIANGFDVTFAKPAEGTIQTVTANYVDVAGNAATDAPATDAATLDTIFPNSMGAAPTVTITTDINNDGVVSSPELNGASTIAVQAAFDKTKVAVGDKVVFSDGITTNTVTLTQADIDNGFASTTFAKPAEGAALTVTATVVDAANNQTPQGSDSAKLDTTASNGNTAPTVTITTDANNDGFVSSAELNGDTTIAVKAAFDATKVAVGDTVRLSDGSTTKDVVLTAADITNGFVTTTFAKPAEGATLNVTATVIDPAGNPTPQGTDSAKLDTTAPTNAAVGLALAISTDANNDAFVNATELGAQTTFTSHITVNSTAVAGDKVVITASNGTTALTPITHTLTAADISNGFDVTFAKPSEGAVQTVTANYVDAAGNAATDTQATDNAKLDTTASNGNAAPTVTITTDANNDGFVNSAELNGDTTIAVKAAFDATKVAVGDTVRLSDGSTTKDVVLTAADITNGFVTTTFAKPAEGGTLNVTATVIDPAGNPTLSGTDSAKLDTTAPTNDAVGLTVGISTDANNDAFVNATELAAQTTFTSHITVNSTAVVGDKVVITASNGSTALTPITHTLTASDIANGFDVTFTKPSEGAVQTVTANYVDAAGNAATDTQATDNAKLDTTAPTNDAVGLTLAISTDANNDAFVNATEINSAATFTSHISVNSTAVVGDKVVITASNGSTALTPITHTLTATDIANGFDVTFAKPSEGAVQTVTANYVDAAGNAATDTKPSDAATLDTIFPNNLGAAPTVTITTDTNNDGLVKSTELNGASTFAVQASFDTARVSVGDKVILTDGVTVNTVVLTQADITNGFVSTSFTKPADGGTMTVTAKISDVAGNVTAAGTDSAQLDITPPNGNAAPTVTITTDTNNDGYVNIAELNGSTTFAIKAAFDKAKVAVGDQVIFSNGSTQNTVTLTQTDITNGYATTTFNKPAEGTALTVTAKISDPAGNQTPAGSDSAILDSIAPNNVGTAPTVTITTDANNDGVVSATELGASTTFAVKAVFDPARVAVGDTVTFSNGSTTTPVVLTQTDIDNGFVLTSFDKPAEGASLTVTAKITDVAGNDTASGSDSATIVSSNTAPILTASSVGGVYTAGGSTGVDLFGSVTAQVGSNTANSNEVSGGQKFQKLVVTATGLLDGSNETMTMAGTAVALTDGTTATLAGGWQASVQGSGSTATLTLTNSTGVDANTLQSFIDGWSYSNSKTTLTVGERTFTITSVQDTGGVANNGVDTSALSITSTVADGNPSLASPTTVSAVKFSGNSGGSDNNSLAGHSVSSAGDVNGDGVADFLVGAPGLDPYVSRTYVVFGKKGSNSGVSAIDLSAIENGVGGFVVYQQNTADHSGFSLSGIGDINGDGLADFIIGAPYSGDLSVSTPNNGHNNGERGLSYVVYGKKDTAQVNLSSIAAGTGGFMIKGEGSELPTGLDPKYYKSDNSGYAVSGVGDVNGDGIADYIVGAPGWTSPDDPTAANPTYTTARLEGRSYVVFGSTAGGTMDLANIAKGNGGFAITGQLGDKSGFSVSSAGDVNGDGLADVIIGAPSNNVDNGRSYVVFGKTSGSGVSLADVAAGTGGFVINGLSTGTLSNNGYFVSSAGDVNGDGLSDVIVGEPFFGNSGEGRSYVIFGKKGTGAVDVASVASGAGGGFAITGETQAAGPSSGWSVSSAGDINGDGLADLIVGSPFTTTSGTDSGTAYVVFGKTDLSSVNLADVRNGTGGFAITGPTNGYSGWSVSAAGDANGDGFADLIVGVPSSATLLSPILPGSSYLIYGGPQYAVGSKVALGVGTSADEFVVGTSSDDVLVGGGGIDRFSAGAGNDTIVLTPSDVANLANNTAASFKTFVSGGEGFDTIRLSGGANLDLTKVSNTGAMGLDENSRIESIERIDMATDAAANTTTIRLKDVIDMSGMNLFNSGTSGLSLVSGTSLDSLVQKHQVMITGNANDAVNINLASDWSKSDTVVSYNSHNYVVYNANNNVAAQLLIDQKIVDAVLVG